MEHEVMNRALRVLMLEDTPTDAELIEYELRRGGGVFTSLRVETRDAFIHALEEFRPDIILSDYKLPDFNGMDALKIVQRDHPEVPVIMVTGALLDTDAVELIHAGAKDYVLKDRLARLAPAVKRALSAEQGIRARKAAEKELQQSEADLRTLVEHSPVAMLVDTGVDENEHIVLMNRKFSGLFGYTLEDVPDVCRWWMLAYPNEKYREKVKAEWTARVEKAIQRHDDIEPMEVTVACKDGSNRYVRISLASIGSRNIITFEDFTERKQMEKKLLKSEIKFRTVYQSSSDAIMLLDEQGFFDCNEATLRMFGYSTRDEVISKYPAELSSPTQPGGEDSISLTRERIATALKDGCIQFEWMCRRCDGSDFFAEILLTAFELDGKRVLQATVRDITERKQAEFAIQHANRALSTLSAVNRNLVNATVEDELLLAICHAITQQRGYSLAWVGYVQHDETKSVKIMAHAGREEGYLDTMRLTWADTERGRGPSGRAIRSGSTQLCQDIANDPLNLPWRDEALRRGYASSIALTLKNESGEVFGVLTVYAEETQAFTKDEIELLEEMAEDLAFGVHTLRTRRERDLALEKIQQQFAQLQDSLEDSVRAIAAIVEMRDPYTAGHQVRVADLAGAIAKQMGLTEEQIHAIHLAGIVHDVGKIQIPSEILSKPGKISTIEFNLIKIHPQAGYDILKDIDFPWPIAQMVLQHHERLDGSGYPQGLKGDAILLEARILSVADVVEAISSHRPYRPGLGIDAALEEIKSLRGTYFDAQAVDACVALFQEKNYVFPA
jgi:PAS domain S-box-containing protein